MNILNVLNTWHIRLIRVKARPHPILLDDFMLLLFLLKTLYNHNIRVPLFQYPPDIS